MIPSVHYNPKTCDYCHTPDLHWGKNKNNKWWLFDADNVSHQCSKAQPTQAQPTQLGTQTGRLSSTDPTPDPTPDPNIARRPDSDPRHKKTHTELQAEFDQIQKDTQHTS